MDVALFSMLTPRGRLVSASYLREEPKMNTALKPETAPDGFVDNEPADEIVNDSLGTVNPADTTDTDPKDDPETGGKGVEGASKRKED